MQNVSVLGKPTHCVLWRCMEEAACGSRPKLCRREQRLWCALRWEKKDNKILSTFDLHSQKKNSYSTAATNARLCVFAQGRLIDHVKKKATSLQRVTYLVFDEADRMFDMGFGGLALSEL